MTCINFKISLFFLSIYVYIDTSTKLSYNGNYYLHLLAFLATQNTTFVKKAFHIKQIFTMSVYDNNYVTYVKPFTFQFTLLKRINTSCKQRKDFSSIYCQHKRFSQNKQFAYTCVLRISCAFAFGYSTEFNKKSIDL